MVISGVASGMIAVIIFDQNNGIVNQVLAAIGLQPVAWQSEARWAMISVMIVAIWLRRRLQHDHLPGRPPGHLARAATRPPRSTAPRAWQQFRSRHRARSSGPSDVLPADHERHRIRSRSSTSIFVMTGGGPGNSTIRPRHLRVPQTASRAGPGEPGYGAAIGVVILLITLDLHRRPVADQPDPRPGRLRSTHGTDHDAPRGPAADRARRTRARDAAAPCGAGRPLGHRRARHRRGRVGHA